MINKNNCKKEEILVAFKLGEDTYRVIFREELSSLIVSKGELESMLDTTLESMMLYTEKVVALNEGKLLVSSEQLNERTFDISTEGDIVISRGDGVADIIRLRPASTMEWVDETDEIKTGTLRLADEGVMPSFVMHKVKTTIYPSARFGLAHNRERYAPNADTVYARSHLANSCRTNDPTLYTPDMWQDICAANTEAWERFMQHYKNRNK